MQKDVQTLLVKTSIHPTAIIDPTASIGDNVVIGPYCVVGPNVVIGSGTVLRNHVVIEKHTTLGRHNTVHSFATLGEDPQDLRYKGEPTYLEIGDYNIFREYVTISRGSTSGTGVTTIGNHNCFLNYSHVGHDSVVENHTLFTNNSCIAGHVHVCDHAILGAYTGVHQFVKIGAYAFLSRAAQINSDVLPYMMVTGAMTNVRGLNSVGLKRHGFSQATIRNLKKAYLIVFKRGNRLQDALMELQQMAKETPEVAAMVEMIETSDRGITR